MTLRDFTVERCDDEAGAAVVFLPSSGPGRVQDMALMNNRARGVSIVDSSRITVANNIIGDNDLEGVLISGKSTGNVVENNLIGTSLGESDAGNGEWGVVSEGTRNMIRGNLIAFNGAGGVKLQANVPMKAGGNTVRANRIGANDATDLGNNGRGVLVEQPAALVTDNLISGNTGSGVELRSSGARRPSGARRRARATRSSRPTATSPASTRGTSARARSSGTR